MDQTGTLFLVQKFLIASKLLKFSVSLKIIDAWRFQNVKTHQIGKIHRCHGKMPIKMNSCQQKDYFSTSNVYMYVCWILLYSFQSQYLDCLRIQLKEKQCAKLSSMRVCIYFWWKPSYEHFLVCLGENRFVSQTCIYEFVLWKNHAFWSILHFK